MKIGILAAAAAGSLVACASGPPPAPTQFAGPVPPSGPGPAGDVARLYNDYLRRLPCPEQATCGAGPLLPVIAARCDGAAEAVDVRCVFLTTTWSKADRVFRCEAAFSTRDGAWRLDEFVEPCSLVGEQPRQGIPAADVPNRRTIEAIESGFALQDDLLTVGVGDTAAMNAAARVQVRRVRCTPREGAAALCSYEASRCLAGEKDEDGDGWCRRQVTFVLVRLIRASNIT